MKRLPALLFLLLPAFLRASGFSASARGGSSAPFLRLPAGARAAALGQAYGAVAEGADAYFWNPAGVSGAPRSAFFSHSAHLDNSFADFASVSFPWKKSRTSLAVGAEYVSAGDVAGFDSNGAAQGSYRPNDLAAGVTLARPVGRFRAGLTAKFIRSTLLDAAQTGALDLGVQSRELSGGRLRLAASVSNLGGKLKYDGVAGNLPLTFRAGGAFKVSPSLAFSSDAVFPRDDGPSLSLGLEGGTSVSGAMSLVWRAGYYSRAVSDLQGFSGYSFGLGFRSKSALGVDYAFLPMGLAGASHTVSLSSRF